MTSQGTSTIKSPEDQGSLLMQSGTDDTSRTPLSQEVSVDGYPTRGLSLKPQRPPLGGFARNPELGPGGASTREDLRVESVVLAMNRASECYELKVRRALWSVPAGSMDLMRWLVGHDYFEKALKVFCCWPLALAVEGTPEPDQPEILLEGFPDYCRPGTSILDCRLLMGREFFRMAKWYWGDCRIQSGRKLPHCEMTHRMSLARTLFGLKGCSEPMEQHLVDAAIEKHSKVMSASPPPGVGECGRSAQLKNYIRAVVAEVVGDSTFDREFRDEPTMPSLSACFGQKRTGKQGGGAWESILHSGNYSCGQQFDEWVVNWALKKGRSEDECLTPSLSRRQLFLTKEKGEWCCVRREFVGYTSPRIYGAQHRPFLCPKVGWTVVDHFLRQEIGYSVTSRINCRVAAVLEACKIRTVSMGESREYLWAKQWNRVVLPIMQRHPTFRLLGTPMELSFLGPDGEVGWPGFTGRYILSGDYSAATDGIYPYWSEFALEILNDYLGVPAELRHISRNCLTRHVMHYSVGGGKLPDGTPVPKRSWSVDQGMGQLMGSPISFPILSILNAACNWMNRDFNADRHILWDDEHFGCRYDLVRDLDDGGGEVWRKVRHVPIRNVPILVNGDDVLVSGDRFDCWEEDVALVGFKPSAGKNYVCSYFATVNSEPFIRVSGEWSRLPYLFLEHLYPNHSVLGESPEGRQCVADERRSMMGVGPLSRLVVERASPLFSRDLVISEFISGNLPRIKLDKTGRPWFLPCYMGGLGILPDSRAADKITADEQMRKYIAYFITRPDPESVRSFKRPTDIDGSECAEWVAEEVSKRVRTVGWELVWEDTVIDRERWMLRDDTSLCQLLEATDLTALRWTGYKPKRRDRWSTIFSKAMATSLSPVSPGKALEMIERGERVAVYRLPAVDPGVSDPLARSDAFIRGIDPVTWTVDDVLGPHLCDDRPPFQGDAVDFGRSLLALDAFRFDHPSGDWNDLLPPRLSSEGETWTPRFSDEDLREIADFEDRVSRYVDEQM